MFSSMSIWKWRFLFWDSLPCGTLPPWWAVISFRELPVCPSPFLLGLALLCTCSPFQHNFTLLSWSSALSRTSWYLLMKKANFPQLEDANSFWRQEEDLSPSSPQLNDVLFLREHCTVCLSSGMTLVACTNLLMAESLGHWVCEILFCLISLLLYIFTECKWKKKATLSATETFHLSDEQIIVHLFPCGGSEAVIELCVSPLQCRMMSSTLERDLLWD